MGAVLSFFRPAPVAQGDWSQQELAEFYRVEAALTQSGLHLTSERGLSDEGDPWFIFCRYDGEVILHFARIDGLYVIASEAFERPQRGPDFRGLLNAVAAQHPTLMPLPQPRSEEGAKRSNLILHPAALLAAIVATAAFQLAGGDAMASELATDGAAAPVADATGDEAHLTPAPVALPDRSAEHAADLVDSEGRQARQALILSAMALVSASLPAEESWHTLSALMTDHDGRGHAASGGGASVAGQTAAPIETVSASSHAESGPVVAAENLAATSFSAGTAPASVMSEPTHSFNLDGFTPAMIPSLATGFAGGPDLSGPHTAELALPIPIFALLPRGIGRDPAATGTVDKAVAAAQTGAASQASAPAPHASGADTTAAPSASPASATGAASPAHASSVAVGTASTSTASTSDTAHTSTASQAGATVQSVQTANAGTVTYTGLLASVTAFIDQHLGAAVSADASGASATSTTTSVSDPWLLSWARTIGSGATSDVLGNLIAHSHAGSGSDAASGTSGDHAAGLASSVAGLASSVAGLASSAASLAASLHLGLGSGGTGQEGTGQASGAAQTGSLTTTGSDTHASGSSSGTGASGSVSTHAGTQTGYLSTTGTVTVGTGTDASRSDGSSTAGGLTSGSSQTIQTGTQLTTVTQAGTGTQTGSQTGDASAALASSPSLDDHARQLISHFLEVTPQAQTIVTDHAFVILDMDASHYTNPDFTLRSWSLGGGVEISIIGLATDTYLAHAASALV